MKKLISTLTVILLFSGISFAQYNHSSALDLAFGLNFPMSSMADGASTGWETTVRYEFNMGGNWAGLISTGYMAFAENNGITYSAVPLVIGTKLYLASGWYGLVETGFHFYSTDINLFGITTSGSSTEWGFAIGTGYEIPLGESVGLDLSTKYQYNGGNLSYWNTRAGLMIYL